MMEEQEDLRYNVEDDTYEYGPVTFPDGSEVLFIIKHEDNSPFKGEWCLKIVAEGDEEKPIVMLPVDKTADNNDDSEIAFKLYDSPEEALEAIVDLIDNDDD